MIYIIKYISIGIACALLGGCKPAASKLKVDAKIINGEVRYFVDRKLFTSLSEVIEAYSPDSLEIHLLSKMSHLEVSIISRNAKLKGVNQIIFLSKSVSIVNDKTQFKKINRADIDTVISERRK